jgi:hypothetical protein
MAVLRLGNLNLEMPGQPAFDTAQAGGQYDSQIAQVDGEQGQLVPPVPEGNYMMGIPGGGVPSDMMMGGPGGPGQPAHDPIVGVNGVPFYGYPNVGTPIGLPGPPHIPLGKPAGLQSLTMRNTTHTELAPPVDHMLIDVNHKPGLSLPEPVKYIQYTEKHPVYQQGEVAQPAWASPSP